MIPESWDLETWFSQLMDVKKKEKKEFSINY